MASKLPQPLNLPEILRLTFTFLDRDSLIACAQVNSLWADGATDILWQDPPFSALEFLVSSGRAQTYAHKITTLLILDDGPDSRECRLAFRQLLFSRSKQMLWCINPLACSQGLLHYLQPSLRRLHMALSSAKVGDKNSPEYHEALDGFFVQLSTRSPHLQEITLEFDLIWKGLLQYLEATPSLRSIKLSGSMTFTNALIRNLAARPNLTRLHLMHSGEVAALVEVNTASLSADIASPFADLQFFSGRLNDDTIFHLIRQMPKLEILCLTLYQPSKTLPAAALSRASDLRILEISFDEADPVIEALDLISIAKGCQRLTEVSMWGSQYHRYYQIDGWVFCKKIDGSSIRDFDICRFSSFLPGLEILWLGCRGGLSVQSLHHLGRNCTKLRECGLFGCVFDVSRLLEYPLSDMTTTLDTGSSTGGNRPLFPKLEILAVDKFINSLNATISVVMSPFRLEAPQLKLFRAQANGPLDEEVVEAFFSPQRDR